MDPLSGHLFVFHNRHFTALKILFWLDGGFCLYYKRLARGRFVLPSLEPGRTASISQAQLAALLEGLDLRQSRQLSRWNPQKSTGIHTDAG
jgi:transposase